MPSSSRSVHRPRAAWRDRGASRWAVLVAVAALLLTSPAMADEAARARTDPGPKAVVKQRVVARDHVSRTLQLVPPCVENLFSPLLRCVPRPQLAEPPDLAVLNAVHGAPHRTPKPYATLFDW